MKCYGAPIFLPWTPGAPHILGWSPDALNPFGTLLSDPTCLATTSPCIYPHLYTVRFLLFPPIPGQHPAQRQVSLCGLGVKNCLALKQ